MIPPLDVIAFVGRGFNRINTNRFVCGRVRFCGFLFVQFFSVLCYYSLTICSTFEMVTLISACFRVVFIIDRNENVKKPKTFYHHRFVKLSIIRLHKRLRRMNFGGKWTFEVTTENSASNLDSISQLFSVA